jgi:hypothetical protein
LDDVALSIMLVCTFVALRRLDRFGTIKERGGDKRLDCRRHCTTHGFGTG